jgi:GNAT superfamily N-acetyltransferase
VEFHCERLKEFLRLTNTMSSEILYRSNSKITTEEFIDLLKRSTLDQRRPVNEPERIKKMLDYGNVLITAWANEKLVGISRALTDHSFCCYLSDLAVDETYQHQGIGKELIKRTHEIAGPHTMLILLAAPAAINYYPKIGMERFEHCFVIKRKS